MLQYKGVTQQKFNSCLIAGNKKIWHVYLYINCMKQFCLALGLLFMFQFSHAQKIEKIFFNLYTDSLKKEVWNYINVDGQLSNGKFIPLDTNHLIFNASFGKWQGNNLFIEQEFQKDSVVITATVKQNPLLIKTVTIFIKKKESSVPLKTEQQILDELNNPSPKKKKKSK